MPSLAQSFSVTGFAGFSFLRLAAYRCPRRYVLRIRLLEGMVAGRAGEIAIRSLSRGRWSSKGRRADVPCPGFSNRLYHPNGARFTVIPGCLRSRFEPFEDFKRDHR